MASTNKPPEIPPRRHSSTFSPNKIVNQSSSGDSQPNSPSFFPRRHSSCIDDNMDSEPDSMCLAVVACCSLVLVSAHPTTYNTYDMSEECVEEPQQSAAQLDYGGAHTFGGAHAFGGLQTLAAKSIAEPSAAYAYMAPSAGASIYGSAAAPILGSAGPQILSSTAARLATANYGAQQIIESAPATTAWQSAPPAIALRAPIPSYGESAATVYGGGGGSSTLQTYDHRPSAAANNDILQIGKSASGYATGYRAAVDSNYALPSASAYLTMNRKWTDSKHAAAAQFRSAATSLGHSLGGSIAAAQPAQLYRYGYAAAAQPQQHQLSYGYAAQPQQHQLSYGYAAQPQQHQLSYGYAAQPQQHQPSYGYAAPAQQQYQPWARDAAAAGGPIAYAAAEQEELCEE